MSFTGKVERHDRLSVPSIRDEVFGKGNGVKEMIFFIAGALRQELRPLTVEEIYDSIQRYQPWRISECKGADKKATARRNIRWILSSSPAFEYDRKTGRWHMTGSPLVQTVGMLRAAPKGSTSIDEMSVDEPPSFDALGDVSEPIDGPTDVDKMLFDETPSLSAPDDVPEPTDGYTMSVDKKPSFNVFGDMPKHMARPRYPMSVYEEPLFNLFGDVPEPIAGPTMSVDEPPFNTFGDMPKPTFGPRHPMAVDKAPLFNLPGDVPEPIAGPTMSVNEIPLFNIPNNVPPALECASELLHSLVNRAAQLKQHHNPHKTLYLTTRCIEIFEGLVEAFRDPPSAFEDAAEALGSLRKLEFLVIEATAVIEKGVGSPTSTSPRLGHPSRDSVSEQMPDTWMSLRDALLKLLVKSHEPSFKSPPNWLQGVEEVKRVDDFLWATLVAQSIRNQDSDASRSELVESSARELLGDLDEITREQKLETTRWLHRESARQFHPSSHPMRMSGSFPTVNPSYFYSIAENEVVDRGLGIPQADADTAETQPPVAFQLTDDQARSIVIEEMGAGFGGSSDVHRGHWTSPWTGRLEIVAIKVLRASRSHEGASPEVEVAGQHLAREIRIWQKLKGPRITPLLGYIFTLPTIPDVEGPAIISAWRKFGTLDRYVVTNPQADRLTLLIQAAEAVNMLHTLKPSPILHLDVKPSNFLINDDGDVELFDFGISLELEDVNSESDQESWWGSTRYQPPEVLIGEETKSTAADVYAFGGVILQVLSGKPPFADITSHAATVRTIVKGETPNRNAYMFSYPSAIVDELWKLMNECWRSAQKDRPTMAVVIERLNQIATMMKDDLHK